MVMGLSVLGLLGCSEPELPNDAGAYEATPLEECPDSPNCVRISLWFDAEPDEVLSAAREALEEIGAGSLELDDEARRIDATFRVFVFTDDVAIAVTSHDDRSALHIRSASRVGRDDLGVNARRVAGFLDVLEL